MFYIPFLGMATIINLFLTASAVLLLLSELCMLPPEPRLSAEHFPCAFAYDLDPDGYSRFTRISFFLLLLPFYASTISERASFLQCSYSP